MAFCGRCGNFINPKNKFCGKCGYDVSKIVRDTGKKVVEELINYIEKKTIIKSKLDDRIKVLAFR